MAEETKIEDSILNDFKFLKHIKDNSMDNIFKIYIRQATQEVELYIGQDTLPNILSGVITQMAEAKFTKAGSEGTTSSSEEGLSYSFNDNDLKPFFPVLNRYIDNLRGSVGRGRIVTFN